MRRRGSASRRAHSCRPPARQRGDTSAARARSQEALEEFSALTARLPLGPDSSTRRRAPAGRPAIPPPDRRRQWGRQGCAVADGRMADKRHGRARSAARVGKQGLSVRPARGAPARRSRPRPFERDVVEPLMPLMSISSVGADSRMFERGDQALPTGEQAGVACPPRSATASFSERTLLIGEWRRLHFRRLPLVFLIVTGHSTGSVLAARRLGRACRRVETRPTSGGRPRQKKSMESRRRQRRQAASAAQSRPPLRARARRPCWRRRTPLISRKAQS